MMIRLLKRRRRNGLNGQQISQISIQFNGIKSGQSSWSIRRSHQKVPANNGQHVADGQKKSWPGIPFNKLSIGVPKEKWANERRVALSPVVVGSLVKKGFTVHVEENAGLEAKFMNHEYEANGAKITDLKKAFQSNIVLKVRSPQLDEIPSFIPKSTLISFLYPAQNQQLIEHLAKKQLNVFAMDCIPRISRAQVFDALSSMANIAGSTQLIHLILEDIFIYIFFISRLQSSY